jgi:signal transduction histidine kinase
VFTAVAGEAGQLLRVRARIVAAGDETRRRIERDRHDGTQQQLVSLILDVRAVQADVRAVQADVRAVQADVRAVQADVWAVQAAVPPELAELEGRRASEHHRAGHRRV